MRVFRPLIFVGARARRRARSPTAGASFDTSLLRLRRAGRTGRPPLCCRSPPPCGAIWWSGASRGRPRSACARREAAPRPCGKRGLSGYITSVSPLRRPVDSSASLGNHDTRPETPFAVNLSRPDARRRCHRLCSWLSWETRFDCAARKLAPMGAMIYNKTLRH